MATLPVPLFEAVQKGVDQVELNQEGYQLVDGYRTLKGGTTARFGSKSLFSISQATGFGVDGLFYWAEKDCVIAVAAGEIFKLTYPSETPIVTSLTNGTPLLQANKPVTFTTDATNIYIANGGKIVATTESGTPAYLTDPDAPITTSHVDYLDGYILAIDGSNRFFWSEANSGSAWSALNFASQSGSPDLLVALKVYQREIYLFGQKTIEVWENDGSTPFARIPGGFIQVGCSAPNAIISDENSLYWLDENRRLVKFTGKTVERLSTKYDREFQSLSSVSDGVAFKVCFDGYVFFVFTFKAANRTLVYNETTDDWCDFGKWDASKAQYDRWMGLSYVYAEGWGKHLVGRSNTSVIAELGRDYHTDDGDLIRLCRTTGHIDFGSLQTKRTNEFRCRAKRGDGLSARTPKVMIRYKLDGRDWSNFKEVSLGNIGEYWHIIRDTRRTIFRTKQYEFSATDAVGIVFGGAEEDVEVLR